MIERIELSIEFEVDYFEPNIKSSIIHSMYLFILCWSFKTSDCERKTYN